MAGEAEMAGAAELAGAVKRETPVGAAAAVVGLWTALAQELPPAVPSCNIPRRADSFSVCALPNAGSRSSRRKHPIRRKGSASSRRTVGSGPTTSAVATEAEAVRGPVAKRYRRRAQTKEANVTERRRMEADQVRPWERRRTSRAEVQRLAPIWGEGEGRGGECVMGGAQIPSGSEEGALYRYEPRHCCVVQACGNQTSLQHPTAKTPAPPTTSHGPAPPA
jgi:hypothetical protein